MKVTIVGAPGAIGQSVVAAFHAVGTPLRLVSRDQKKLKALAGPRDEMVMADVATDAGCDSALKDADAAVYALGVPYTKKDFAAYPDMMRKFIAAANRQKVKRLLLVTNVYPYGRPQSALVSETHPRMPSAVKGQYRKEQEDIFLDGAKAGLEVISLRLPDFYGPHVTTSLMTGVVSAAVRGKTATLLGPCDTPHEFVFTPDVGPVIRALLEKKGKINGAYNLAGAGHITQRGLAELIFKAAGQAPKISVLPKGLMPVVGLFIPVLRELREMHYLHETPVLLDDRKLKTLLPNLKKTSYEEGARLAVAAERGGFDAAGAQG